MKTKGCSGLSYDMSWTDAPGAGRRGGDDDKGVTVLVDRKASLFLIGTVMDYEVKTPDGRLHLHQPERKGPLRLRRELSRLTSAPPSRIATQSASPPPASPPPASPPT